MANPVAEFETNLGSFRAELFEDLAPITVANFMELVGKEFYDGVVFHRVIKEFMIQGGCPEGSGRGGPGYTIQDEFHDSLQHDAAGVLSMANAGPNTGGSQFFVTLAPTAWLNGKHAVFGKIIDGMDIIETIGKIDTDGSDRPFNAVTMQSVKVTKAAE